MTTDEARRELRARFAHARDDRCFHRTNVCHHGYARVERSNHDVGGKSDRYRHDDEVEVTELGDAVDRFVDRAHLARGACAIRFGVVAGDRDAVSAQREPDGTADQSGTDDPDPVHSGSSRGKVAAPSR